jgi:hypothetical protein
MKDGHIEITFGTWTRWKDRPSLRLTSPKAGVYLFGFFRSPPPNPPTPDSLPFELIYVGDAKNLNNRPLSEPHHKIVKRLPALFPEMAFEQLYVSICPLYDAPSDLGHDIAASMKYAIDRTRSFYIESWLALKYAEQHGHPPIMQVKDAEWNQAWVAEVVRKLRKT